MLLDSIPKFCLQCIVRFQAQCPHLQSFTFGGMHFSAGEVWDDFTIQCSNCGVNLINLPDTFNPLLEDEMPPF